MWRLSGTHVCSVGIQRVSANEQIFWILSMSSITFRKFDPVFSCMLSLSYMLSMEGD